MSLQPTQPPQASSTSTPARAELDLLQSQLADRQSTVRFAQAGVSVVAAFIMSGAASKLFWDSHKLHPGHFPWLGCGASLVALFFTVFAALQYAVGRRHLRRELNLFAALQELRRHLRMDDPSALLPQ